MIWAFLIWHFMGGAAGLSGAYLTSANIAGLEKQVADVVEDSGRRRSATRTLKSLRKELKAYEKGYAASGDDLAALYLDHSDNREEALAVLANVNTDWQQAQERALDARFALVGTLTEEEWSALFEPGQP